MRPETLLRASALNPRVAMAGGNALIENPRLALEAGADAVSHDAPTAVISHATGEAFGRRSLSIE